MRQNLVRLQNGQFMKSPRTHRLVLLLAVVFAFILTAAPARNGLPGNLPVDDLPAGPARAVAGNRSETTI